MGGRKKKRGGVQVAVSCRSTQSKAEKTKRPTKAGNGSLGGVGWGRLPPPLPLVFPKSREVGQNPSQTSPQIPHPTYAYGLESMNHNGDVPSSRCPKHPSQPPFTGFCSACLLERLSTAPARCFPSPSPVAAAAEISTEIPQPRVRTTLLYLFQLDDDQEDQGQQVRVDQEDEQGRQLQRKRSLRQSCEWIVCCDATADSRQSWDGSADAPPAQFQPHHQGQGLRHQACPDAQEIPIRVLEARPLSPRRPNQSRLRLFCRNGLRDILGGGFFFYPCCCCCPTSVLFVQETLPPRPQSQCSLLLASD
ncbi:hypothetical protein OsJ_04984 [Oryza sativa Japonica Group]|uniref:Uncharacterized protein n=1 Tax=Oryza sativa subsp. japonica TaxID=39947 RepID=A3A245_ORYSJ|nr:hypothetical protein OsJ_04984 [Oryza sativa Japonica Group]